MKVSKLGIKMYEVDDELPAGNATGCAINQLRIEVNKIAEVLDAISEKVEKIEKERIKA